MRVAHGVQLVERLLDFGIDPGLLAVGGLARAYPDHIGEGLVGRHPELVRPDGFAQRARHPEIVERDDGPRFWFHPEGFRIIPGVRHRKYARSIGFHKKIKINAHAPGIT